MNKIIYNPVLVFIIGFITFGIGNLIFIFLYSEYTAREYGAKIIPTKEVVLNLLTFGVYGIYWTYRTIITVESESSRVSAVPFIGAIISAVPFLRCVSMAVISSKISTQS